MENQSIIEKFKLKELEQISKQISKNFVFFNQKFDKLRHNIFIIILPIAEINKFQQKINYLIVIDNNCKIPDYFDYDFGYCRAIKREIKFLNEIETKFLRFDFDNSKYAMTNRKSYLKVKNLTENDKVVIFTFRKKRKVGFDRH